MSINSNDETQAPRSPCLGSLLLLLFLSNDGHVSDKDRGRIFCIYTHRYTYIYICMCMCMCIYIYINKKYPIYTSIYYVAGTALCASMSKSCTVSALGLSHFSQEVRELQGAERLLEFRMYRVEALGFIGLKAVEALGCRV